MAKDLKPLLPFIAIGLGVYLWKKFVSTGDGIFNQVFGKTEAEKNTETTAAVIEKIPVNVQLATFSAQQGQIYAESLQKAMNPISGFSPDYDGTNEDAVLEVFKKIINKHDAKLVYKGFGLRQYTKNWFLDNQRLDLVGWLRAELSSADLSKLQTKLNWMVYE